MELLCNFFEIFYYASCRNGTDRRFLFFLFLGIFQPILAWNEAIMVYFNFPNFIAIFLEFSVSRLVGTERKDNFYFLSFSAFSNLFWLERSTMVFFNFFNFFTIFFLNFLSRVVEERNGPIIFIFSLFRHFPTYFGLKWSHNGIF